MTCNKCGEEPKKSCGAFPKAVIEIDNPEKIVLLRKVLVPASMGDESTFPPTIGKYHNVLLEYEASGGIYLYSSDGIPTKLSSDVTELQAQLNALRVRIGEEEVARADADTALSGRITSLDNSLATVAKTGSYNDLSNKPTIGNGTLTIKKNGSNVGTFTANATTNKAIDISVPTKTSDLTNDGSDGTSTYVEADELSTVATTGSYNDLTNKPTIPTVNNATLTIQKNGTNVQTFTANSSTNKTANITVPTAVSELTNDSGYATTTQLNNGLATKQDTLTAGDNIQINGNTISATDTTYTAGNAIDITNGEISADIHPADFFTAEDTVSDCGSDLGLDNTMASTLKSVELKGDTYQQTYTGKNLSPYPYADGGSKVIRGITFTAASDGSVTLNGTNDGTANSAYYIYYNDSSSLQFEAGTYYFIPPSNTNIGYVMYDGTSYYDFSNASNYSQTFSSAKSIRYIYIQVRKGNTAVFNNLKIYPMLTTLPNPTESDYEPYVGGIPAPNPDYPQDIQVVTGEQTVKMTGKNLFPTVPQTSSSTGITIARNSDGTYNISGTATSEFNAISWVEDLSAFADGQTYTLSVSEQVGALLVLVDMYNGNTWLRSFPRPGGTTLSQTAALNLNNATKIKFSLRVQSGKTVNLTNLAIQFERGAATAYEPYQPQSYEINLGKNLFQAPTAAKSTWQAVYTKLTSNSVTVAKSAPAISETSAYAEVNLFGLLPNTTYTLSYETTVSGTPQIGAGTARSRVNNVWLGFSVDNKLTFTTDASAIASVGLYALYGTDVAGDTTVTFYNIQLEVGTNASEYAPHFAPIELCKIGDYQDYIYKSGDDWYIHKETNAKTIDGTEWGWGKSGVSQNNAYYLSTDIFNDMSRDGMGVGQLDTHITPTFSRYFIATSSNNIFTTDTIGLGFNAQTPPSQRLDLRIGVGLSSSLNTVQSFKDWLGANKPTIYYALETPADILITNMDLVAQLNALAKAKSYNDQTNIIITTAGDNLPATLCVEAYRKSLSGVIEAIDNACTCGERATHLVLSNPTTATWSEIGSIAIPYPDESAVVMGTFASTDVVFTKDDGTTMTVGDLYTALTNGKSFEIDLPFGEINSACARDSAAIVATVENVKLDGSSKQTLDQTSQGHLSETYTSSVPVSVILPAPWRRMLLDERFGVEHLMRDDGDTMTSSYGFVVNTYENFQPPR